MKKEYTTPALKVIVIDLDVIVASSEIELITEHDNHYKKALDFE